jgi:DNA-binding MarR family transcriptional regulator
VTSIDGAINPGRDPDLEELLRQMCHLAVAIEHSIAAPGAIEPTGGTNLTDLGALVAVGVVGPLHPGEIASALGIGTSAASKVVRRLSARGLVEPFRRPMDLDGRTVTVRITASGRRAVRRFEHVVATLTGDLVSMLTALTSIGAQDHGARIEDPAGQPTVTPPVAIGLFEFVAEVDRPIAGAAAELEVLHPTDPRGLLILLELRRRGRLRPGEVSGIIGRARPAGHRLTRRLVEDGLVRREPGTDRDRRVVPLRMTDAGNQKIDEILAALDGALPSIRSAARLLLDSLNAS